LSVLAYNLQIIGNLPVKQQIQKDEKSLQDKKRIETSRILLVQQHEKLKETS
jgi:hypothetical protein